MQPSCLPAPWHLLHSHPQGCSGHSREGPMWQFGAYLGDISALSPSVPSNGSSKNSLKTSWLFPTHWGSFPLSLSALTPYKSQHLRIATDKRFLMPQTLHTVFLERGFHGSLQFAAILLDNAGTTGKGLKQSRL